MELSDIDGVLEIEKASFPRPWKRRNFVSELTIPLSHPMVLLNERGEVIGYIMLRLTEPVVHILNIAVREDVRRCGLGSMLLREAFKLAKKHRMKGIYLEVRVSNTPAIRLYQKHGFFILERIRGYYMDGEDAFAMMAVLEPPDEPAPSDT